MFLTQNCPDLELELPPWIPSSPQGPGLLFCSGSIPSDRSAVLWELQKNTGWQRWRRGENLGAGHIATTGQPFSIIGYICDVMRSTMKQTTLAQNTSGKFINHNHPTHTGQSSQTKRKKIQVCKVRKPQSHNNGHLFLYIHICVCMYICIKHF